MSGPSAQPRLPAAAPLTLVRAPAGSEDDTPSSGASAAQAEPLPATPSEARIAPAGPPGSATLFVLNSADANIQVLDPATREEIGRVNVLRETHHLVVTPDGKYVMVGDSGGNEMLLLDPRTGELKSRERISNPYHMEFSPDGKRLVVTSLRRSQVDIYKYENEKLTLQARLRTGSKPSHLAYRPDGKVAYVTLQGVRGLVAIDLEKGEAMWNLEVGPEPAGVIWHNGRLLVGIMGSDYVAVVDPETRSVERTIQIAKGAHAVFKGPPNEKGEPAVLYVTSRVESRITALDPQTLKIVQQWNVPGGPDCITFDAEGRLWVTLRWIGRVGVLDPETGAQEQFRVGRSPHGILIHQNVASR
ncbi:PQQ-binding-like beta-propeller repeat protein [Acetobacteraceae bacterium H6797]|nr:PQQ-binding-like beta-propeller repeat protein [Acetobacteraceae bacterium H6797]